MKYIRTEEGHIYKRLFIDRAIINGVCDKDLNPIGETIIKESDSLEELCDEFVWKWNKDEFPYSTLRQFERIGGYGDLQREIRNGLNYGKYLNQDYEIYGCMWADKGLIYVAKMNDKGELELL